MNTEKLSTLIDRLIAKTESGELRWKEGVRPRTYQLSFPDSSVVVEDAAGLAASAAGIGPSLRVLDKGGEIAVSVSASNLSNVATVLGAELTGAERPLMADPEKLKRLVKAAQRSVWRVRERAVDDLLAHLE